MAEGWANFEKTCSEAGVGELPHLLRHVKTATTPTPTGTPTTQMKIEGEEEEEEAMDTQQSGEIRDKPIHVTVGGKTKFYRCPNCDITPKTSKNGMDSHIRAVHTKKALVCSLCPFSTYNMDSLTRHEKEHK